MIDAATFAALHHAAFTQSRPWSANEFDDLMGMSGCFAIGDPCAAALVRVVADEAELLTIATHPDHRRQGRARQLMDQWQAMARDRGAERAFLEVAEDNPAAIALYSACGFTTAGRRRGYYPRPSAPAADAVIMTRDLTA